MSILIFHYFLFLKRISAPDKLSLMEDGANLCSKRQELSLSRILERIYCPNRRKPEMAPAAYRSEEHLQKLSGKSYLK